jgi:methyl-accepting chemotaxis protein
MGLLDPFLAPLRGALAATEHDVVREIRGVEHIEHRVLEAADAIRDATESIEAHVGVIETLATSINPLAESVNRLTAQMAELNQVLAPLAAAERDVSRLEHLFGRHRHGRPDDAPDSAGAGD